MANQTPERVKPSISARFGETIQVLQESYLRSRDLSAASHFTRFGLTDAGIARLAAEGGLVLTTDQPLAAYLQGIGIDAIDFNDMK